MSDRRAFLLAALAVPVFPVIAQDVDRTEFDSTLAGVRHLIHGAPEWMRMLAVMALDGIGPEGIVDIVDNKARPSARLIQLITALGEGRAYCTRSGSWT
jgi:hypothetical protein